MPDSFVDMDGPGARLEPVGRDLQRRAAVVPATGAPVAEVDAAIRRATLRVARLLADDHAGRRARRRAHLRARRRRTAICPRSCAILQVASEGPLIDTFFYGAPMAVT